MNHCFLPNAAGPPHIGHVLNAAMNYLLHLQDTWLCEWKPDANAPAVYYPERPKWILCYDKFADEKCKPLYSDLLCWMGIPAELEVDLQDRPLVTAIINSEMRLPVREPYLHGHTPWPGHMEKIAFLAGYGIRRIARAHHGPMVEMSANEKVFADMMRTPYPQVIYTPALSDGNGPICAAAGIDEYRVDDLFAVPGSFEAVAGYLRSLVHADDEREYVGSKMNRFWRILTPAARAYSRLAALFECFGVFSLNDALCLNINNHIPTIWRSTAGIGDVPTSAAGTAPSASSEGSPPTAAARPATNEGRGLRTVAPYLDPDQDFPPPSPDAPPTTSSTAPPAVTSPAELVSGTPSAGSAAVSLHPSPGGVTNFVPSGFGVPTPDQSKPLASFTMAEQDPLPDFSKELVRSSSVPDHPSPPST